MSVSLSDPVEPDEILLPVPSDETLVLDPIHSSPRRGDIDAKQEQVGRVIEAMGCDGAILLMPSHVAWFTGGMNVRGLIADSERPGVFTDGRQRWLLCSNIDTPRLFDEELDRLGFQLKEWSWEGGRADLLAHLVLGRKVACDRPFPNTPLINDRLRPFVRVLSSVEEEAYRDLGKVLAHALEATGRNLERGQTEEEVAGQIGHRLLRHGAEPAVISVTADGRADTFRRAGFTPIPVTRTCVIQATAMRAGLYATASRSISFGPPPEEFRAAFDSAQKLAAVYRLMSIPGESIGKAGAAGRALLLNTPFEFDYRMSQPGYGAGRFPAEELRRAGLDEPFVAGQPIVWQPRVGPAAVVDTVVVSATGPMAITGVEDWPFRRARVKEHAFDLPEILVRSGE